MNVNVTQHQQLLSFLFSISSSQRRSLAYLQYLHMFQCLLLCRMWKKTKNTSVGSVTHSSPWRQGLRIHQFCLVGGGVARFCHLTAQLFLRLEFSPGKRSCSNPAVLWSTDTNSAGGWQLNSQVFFLNHITNQCYSSGIIIFSSFGKCVFQEAFIKFYFCLFYKSLFLLTFLSRFTLLL